MGGMLTNDINMKTKTEMQGAVLPGNSTAEIRSYAVPEPGWGQVLLRMKRRPSADRIFAAFIVSIWAKGRKATRA